MKISNFKFQISKQGFTLIEILIVISIIGILAVALTSSLNPIFQIKKGADGGRKNDLRQYQIALENYANNNSGVYPVSTAIVTAKSLCNTGSPPPLQSYMSGCVDDTKTPGNYKYISNSTGLIWVLWAQLDASSNQYWVICSIGKSGLWTSTSPPSSSNCPI
ncbi:MAG: prepilin-type N-terminal cleavage/methylation domain-containing protein [Candidatus Blackburnbacteria bacterium]|nr:prepilin-type N-terminal cleavage/methylation domain-containing protein [Candidatus Blackburnbacteria bacterium]